jgi:hypothetical protein
VAVNTKLPGVSSGLFFGLFVEIFKEINGDIVVRPSFCLVGDTVIN